MQKRQGGGSPSHARRLPPGESQAAARCRVDAKAATNHAAGNWNVLHKDVRCGAVPCAPNVESAAPGA
ncbi:hypothetical protein GUJ93_ZPchr0001g32113 [Zizania palustris]|uniref:Uncharacterized protein n=1 Tax=Zizania palustris TaxID=103762 RepID=A0A8J5VNQ8_ZIZPA|nr:hypothetical protein GUJ93_ZPchr0001g32113 [Zizania palustris]